MKLRKSPTALRTVVRVPPGWDSAAEACCCVVIHHLTPLGLTPGYLDLGDVDFHSKPLRYLFLWGAFKE